MVSRAVWIDPLIFRAMCLSFIDIESDISHYFIIYVEITEAQDLTTI